MVIKRTIALLAVLAVLLVPIGMSADAEPEAAFDAAASYFDGQVSVSGTVPSGYETDSHVEIRIASGNVELASGYALASSTGVFNTNIKVALSHGDYSVTLKLLSISKDTLAITKTLTVDESTDAIHVISLSISPSEKSLYVGDTVILGCVFNPVTASAPFKVVEWSSDNTSIATVDQNGKVTAVSAGTAVIKAVTADGAEATCTVAVRNQSSGGSSQTTALSIDYSSLTTYEDGSSPVTLKAVFPSSVSKNSLKWSVSPKAIASFQESQTDGSDQVTLIGNNRGTATVTLTSVQTGEKVEIKVSVLEIPTSQYTFFLRMDLDYDKANTEGTGFSSEDLKEGITITGSGQNAGEALKSALKANHLTEGKASEGGQYEFLNKGDLKYWVLNIFGMETIKYSNGDYKYWIQYHDEAVYPEGKTYSSHTLGWYTQGGKFDLIYGITDANEQVVDPNAHEGEQGEVTSPDDPDSPYSGDNGQSSQTETVTNPDGSSTSTTTSADGKTTTVVETDADGNKTTTEIVKNDDGSQTETVINSDGSTQVTNTDKPVVTIEDGTTTTETSSSTVSKDAEGNTVGVVETVDTVIENADGSEEIIRAETVKDADGNVTGSTEVSEIKNADGNVTGTSSIVKDAAGNEVSYEKTETVPETTTTDSDGNKVTESSSKTDVRDETGKVTVTEESNKVVVGTDGQKETEKVTSETVTAANGNTTSVKTTETTVEGADSIYTATQVETKDATGKVTVTEESIKETVGEDGQKETEKVSSETVTAANGTTTSTKTTETTVEDADTILTAVQSESKDAAGKETFEKKVEAESKDGNVKSTAEIPAGSDRAEVVTTVKAESDNGTHELTEGQVQQALAIQEMVSDQISEDVKEQIKVIQVESSTKDVSLTVSKEAVKAASDAESDLRIVSENGSMSVSKEILSNLSAEESITMSMESASKSDLNDSQKEAVPDGSTIVDLKVLSGETSVGDRLGGTVTMTIKHISAKGTVAVAYYVADDGTKEKLDGSYDAEKQEMTVKTTHCSIYAVIDEVPSESPSIDEDSGSDNTMLYIGIAVAAIAVIAIAAVLHMRKN